MIRILTDSSTLYSVSEGEKAGIDVAMLTVTIGGRTYREFEEIDSEKFVGLINQGNIPTSSQPAPGEVIDLYNKYPDDEILNISMADGLSGTYQSACGARGQVRDPGRITVLNSRTLCGPHRFLVNKARELAGQGFTIEKILTKLKSHMATSKSFLIPMDFDYLTRGGRLSPIVARIGKLIKLVPVMTLTEDCRQLTRFSLQRTYRRAVQSIIEEFRACGVDHTYQVSITHSFVEDLARTAKEMISQAFLATEIVTYRLSPVFTVQGGPKCIAIQMIQK